MQNRFLSFSLLIFLLAFAVSCEKNKKQKKYIKIERKTILQKSKPKKPHIRNKFSEHFLKKFKKNVKNKAMLYPNIFFVEALHNRKEISLTFDDGPDKKYTILVLKILKKYNVKATFFMTGKRIKKYSKILKIIDKEGHLIGNHTVNHLKEHSFSISKYYRDEIEEFNNILYKNIGYRSAIFRPPYGIISNKEIDYYGKKGFKIIMWSIDSMDWHPKFKNVKNISNQIMGNIHSGAIIIMHDACNQNCVNVRVLDDMIPKLKKLGYKFVTVETLLGIKGKL